MVNKVMTKNNVPLAFTLMYASGSNSIRATAEVLKYDWAQEGVKVHLLPLPVNQVFANASQSDGSKWNMAYWGGGWTYQLDYYPTGGALFGSKGADNGGGYKSSTMDHLINQTYKPGTPQQITTAMNRYQAYAAKHLPVLWMPWFPQGYARVIGFNVHANNIQGTVKYLNPVNDFLYANYWSLTK